MSIRPFLIALLVAAGLAATTIPVEQPATEVCLGAVKVVKCMPPEA